MAEKTIKVCLTNRGEDSETPWAQDLGPAPGVKGGRRVRLVNVPFLHAKPTWGDVVVVSPVADGVLTWDRDGVPWKDIAARIAEDGGRWAMIIDYAPHPGDPTGDVAFRALSKACETADVVCEGAWGPQGDVSGRAYLAVKSDTDADEVMEALRAAALPCELAQIHPAPAKGKEKRLQATGSRLQARKKARPTKPKPKPKPTKPKPKPTKPMAKTKAKKR
jgi:hypothetical protein